MKTKHHFIAALMLALAAFAAHAEASAEKSLYERGLELASELYEQASSEEMVKCVMNHYTWETIQNEDAALKKSELAACYELRPDYDSLMSSEGIAELFASLPPAAKKRAKQWLHVMFLGDYNGRIKGFTYAALDALFTAAALFDSSELKDSTIYFYVFKRSHPVLVTFTKGEGNAVLARASFIFEEKLFDASAKTVAEILFTHSLYVDCTVMRVK